MNDPVARGQRWKLFYEEEGGLRDILESLRVAYLERLSAVEPWETDKLVKLSVASKVTKAVDGEIQAIIDAGKVEAAHRDHIKRIEKIPSAKRKFL